MIYAILHCWNLMLNLTKQLCGLPKIFHICINILTLKFRNKKNAFFFAFMMYMCILALKFKIIQTNSVIHIFNNLLHSLYFHTYNQWYWNSWEIGQISTNFFSLCTEINILKFKCLLRWICRHIAKLYKNKYILKFI